MRREVVVTGVGAVTPLGIGARALHERWLAGRSGIEDGEGAATEFNPTEHLSVKEVRRADRFTQFAAQNFAGCDFGNHVDELYHVNLFVARQFAVGKGKNFFGSGTMALANYHKALDQFTGLVIGNADDG